METKTYSRQIWIQQHSPEIRIFYTVCHPTSGTTKGTILLIHGFPETSHQFRHVLQPLAAAGYKIIAPDYRGAGYSSKPPSGYTKAVLAQDLHTLLTKHERITDPVHVVGHDIGGMIAHAYVAQFPDHVASIIWGECPLPGTAFYDEIKHTPPVWHFDFQAQSDIAAALVAGKERMYVKHFYDRIGQNPAAFSNEDVEFYATQYAAAGAMLAAFEVYRMFEEDAEQNRAWLKEKGKVKVRALTLSGEFVFMTPRALEMALEMYEDVEGAVVEGSGHWLAEENPKDFVAKVLGFVGK